MQFSRMRINNHFNVPKELFFSRIDNDFEILDHFYSPVTNFKSPIVFSFGWVFVKSPVGFVFTIISSNVYLPLKYYIF